MVDQKLEVLEYRRQRGQQLRDEVLFKILSQLDEHNITLVEITEYYQTKYSKRINANQIHAARAAKRRTEVARNAINTRWKKHFDFLKGSSTYADKLKVLGSQEVSVSLPPAEELTPAPTPPLEVEIEQPSGLEGMLSSFGDS